MATTNPGLTYSDGANAFARSRFLGMPFDRIEQGSVLQMLKARRCRDPFRYLVTPNVDHVIRTMKDPALLGAYEDAFLSVCDSTPIARLARVLNLHLPLVTGADLTGRLFQSVLNDGDEVTLVAATHEIARALEKAYPRLRFRSLVPPPDVARDPVLVQQCVDFVARQPARFILLAIGAPASELIAYRLAHDPRASGTALCIGAGIEFLLETKKRAPMWMRRAGLEWLHRLGSEPRRLWRRYAYAVLPLARLFASEVMSRSRRPV
jgi:exopolysaccharide biosynthesis WecB/TagA/CpsF family protein